MQKTSISIRLDEDVATLLLDEAAERGESASCYFSKAAFMRFNMDRHQLTLDRNPLIFQPPKKHA